MTISPVTVLFSNMSTDSSALVNHLMFSPWRKILSKHIPIRMIQFSGTTWQPGYLNTTEISMEGGQLPSTSYKCACCCWQERPFKVKAVNIIHVLNATVQELSIWKMNSALTHHWYWNNTCIVRKYTIRLG